MLSQAARRRKEQEPPQAWGLSISVGPASQIVWQQAVCATPDTCVLVDGVPCPHRVS